ncbi:winged helix-turn-helix domain-containing protein [Rossellomorea oryzaecorticis]|uniref:Winged helix-turn-helix domain-containing protein n=1 Tax=Rossellomorea oryzaecorticis TaxID=1396505 RepID=A0ABU9K5T7_9BACI
MKYYSPQSKEKISLKVESSPVWEIILGIAGYTHSKLRHTFDFDEKWKMDSPSMPAALQNRLIWIEETNSWFALIMLQNKLSAETIRDFSNSLYQVTYEEFYEIVLPYKNRECENLRRSLAENMLNNELLNTYVEQFKDHEFLGGYIQNLSRQGLDELRELLIDSVQEWFAWISQKEEWSTWSKALQYEDKLQASLDEKNPIEEIERITGGVRYVPEPSIWTIKLIPHVSYRPWVMEQRTSETKLFFYPVKEEYLLEPGVPGQDLINGHKALGDGTRLKLLYELMKGPLSLQEISGRFNLSKTTVHHQLSLLKAAKLVRTDKGIYSINEIQIHSLTNKLEQFLGIRK